MSGFSEAMIDLIARLDERRVSEVKAWAVVTIDREFDEVVNVTGPYETPEQALVAAGEMDREDARLQESPDDPGWQHVVVPQWEPAT